MLKFGCFAGARDALLEAIEDGILTREDDEKILLLHLYYESFCEPNSFWYAAGLLYALGITVCSL
jgi:hypothetical protein